MSEKANAERLEAGDPRLIVRWAQRYAKSRTISFLVQWFFIVAMVSVIALAASLTNAAYLAGRHGVFAVSIIAMGITILALAWFSVSRWGGELIARITQWLYGREGYVAYLEEGGDFATPWWLTGLGGGLVIYHLLGALVVSFDYSLIRYMQPYSALYMVPFLLTMILYQGLGFWAWIWPLLYGLHAILVLADAPIRLSGQWEMMNMIVPVFGYGLVAILTGHAYSRFALWKLKRLARSGLDSNTSKTDGADDEGTGT